MIGRKKLIFLKETFKPLSESLYKGKLHIQLLTMTGYKHDEARNNFIGLDLKKKVKL